MRNRALLIVAIALVVAATFVCVPASLKVHDTPCDSACQTAWADVYAKETATEEARD